MPYGHFLFTRAKCTKYKYSVASFSRKERGFKRELYLKNSSLTPLFMYQKLFKNFALKNKWIFTLIFVSITLSLFGYIFSNALSSNFLDSIEKDARSNLGGDFMVDLWNAGEDIFDTFYESFAYKNNVEIVKDFTLRSSIEADEIIPLTIHYSSTWYPLYWEFEKKIINPSWDIIISEELHQKISSKKSITLIWKDYTVKWLYKTLPSNITSFFWEEHAFLDHVLYKNALTNDQNTLIEKNYYIKNINPSLYDSILADLKSSAKVYNFRVRDYKGWWDRFEDIITTLRSYINSAVLFSFFLTATIIFLSSASFFIKERKEISILRLLGMRNIQFISFYLLLFGWVFVSWFIIAILLSTISFYALQQSIEITANFSLPMESIVLGGLVGIVLLSFSIALPVLKFLHSEANGWLQEDFFIKLSLKEKDLWILLFLIMSISLSLMLWYSITASLIVSAWILLFILIFGFFLSLLLKLIYKRSQSLRKRKFIYFDVIRSTIKPWNMSVLTSLSFFIVFFIGLFILILFGNFYQRLNINLENDNNFFALNIDADTYKKLTPELQEDAFAMIKWRILKINNIPREEYIWKNVKWQRGRRFSREYNITDNALSSTRILRWDTVWKWEVSMDDNFASDLGADIWDTITFQIYGLEKTLKVVNIRESQDASINPFFYFQIYAAEFTKFPKIYFISSYIDPDKIETTKKYFFDVSGWTASFIEVEKILQELKDISTKVLLVIQTLFGYIATFCILTIIVITLFFKEFQKKNARLYHFIWFTHADNARKSFFEYVYLATLMKIIAIILVSVASYYLIWKSSFLSFDMWVYFISIWIIIWIYSLLMLILWFWIKK